MSSRQVAKALGAEMVAFILFLMYSGRRTLPGEMRRCRRQQEKRRARISDAERDKLIARWTERTSQGERPGTVKGETHVRTTTKQVSR